MRPGSAKSELEGACTDDRDCVDNGRAESTALAAGRVSFPILDTRIARYRSARRLVCGASPPHPDFPPFFPCNPASRLQELPMTVAREIVFIDSDIADISDFVANLRQ